MRGMLLSLLILFGLAPMIIGGIVTAHNFTAKETLTLESPLERVSAPPEHVRRYPEGYAEYREEALTEPYRGSGGGSPGMEVWVAAVGTVNSVIMGWVMVFFHFRYKRRE